MSITSKILWFCYLCLVAVSTFTIAAPELDLTYAPEFEYLPINEQLFSVVVSIVAPKTDGGGSRAPISLSAVLDRSGSMRGEKLRLLKGSTEFLVESLQTGDYMGVVSYSSRSTIDVPLTKVTSTSKGGLIESIESIDAIGSTNLAAGLFDGLDQQTSADVSDGFVKAVLLFTDGLANRGVTSISSITETIERKLNVKGPPTVYALGFGGDHDSRFLQDIAEAGDGVYVFVKDESSIASSIGEIFGGLSTTLAQDIKVTFTPRNGAEIVHVYGGSVSSNNMMTTFPDIFAEERRDILVDLKLPIVNSPIDAQLVLVVELEYFNSISETKENKKISIVVDRRKGKLDAKPQPLVEKTRLRNRVADDIETAVKQKEQGDTDGATKTLDKTIDTLESSSESGSAEVQALKSDVQETKDEVSSEEDLSQSDSNRFAAGAASVRSQRAAGSGGVGFASVARTSAQADFAERASSSVGKR